MLFRGDLQLKSFLNFHVRMWCECIFVSRESFCFLLLYVPATCIVLKVCHVKTKWAILRFYFISVNFFLFDLWKISRLFLMNLLLKPLHCWVKFSLVIFYLFGHIFLFYWEFYVYCRDLTPTLNIFNGSYFSLRSAKFTSFWQNRNRIFFVSK